MGVVYKARDTHLDRPVAVKVLGADAVTNPERKKRFAQEAKAASALNHPNIVHIYDIDTWQGVDFIAMEFVDGKTLEQVLGRHPLAPREALKHAVQVADALAKAHSAGIVHRDLKPSNVMVTADGLIKVLDFGLAKLTERAEDDAATVTLDRAPRTEEGTVLGTVSYMSPEQAEGKKVDARSDIFSFGSLLYEMVAGRRAFRGESKAATLAAILREEPPALHESVEGLHPEVERIVTRCLRKDPARRFQHMDDLKVALDELKEESESGRLAAAASHAARRRSPVAAALITLAVVAAAGGAWWLARGRSPRSIEGPVLTRLTSDPGLTTEPALSPDGKLVAYASDRAGENLDIWVQQLAGGEPHRITSDLADDGEPAFSPDGGRIAFRSEREGGGIFVVSTFGGAARKIAGDGHRPRFSPDGNWIAYSAGERAGLLFLTAKTYVIPAAGGTPRQLRPDLGSLWNPVWSPDSKRLLVAAARGAGRQDADWYAVSVGSEAAVKTGAMDLLRAHKLVAATVTEGASFQPIPGVWTEDGIIFAAGLGDSINLWQVAISPKDFRVSGPPRRLTSGAGFEGDPSLWQGAGKTRLVFSSLTENVDIWSLAINPDQARVLGEPQRLTSDVAADIRPSITPDGRAMVFNSRRSGNWDVWAKDLVTGRETALTSTPQNEENPRISPDGARIIYRVAQEKTTTTYLIPAAGGLPQKVTEDCRGVFPWDFDNRRFICTGPGGFSLLDVASGERKRIVEGSGSAARLSWDNRWITFYRAIGPGKAQVYIAPVRDGPPVGDKEWIAVTDGQTRDALPEFSPDGDLMYFLSLRDGWDCLWAQRLDPSTKKPAGAAFPVQHFHSARRSPVYVRAGQRAMSLGRDKIVFTMEERTGNVWMAELESAK